MDGETLVLRVGGKDTELLGIDRDDEHEAALVAARARHRPGGRPLRATVPRHAVRGGQPSASRSRAGVGRAAPDGCIYERPAIAARFDSFRVVETYAETAAAHGVRIPPELRRGARGRGRDRGTRARQRPSCRATTICCALNFIDDGERTWIVDWEYAGMGDRVLRSRELRRQQRVRRGRRAGCCSTPTAAAITERADADALHVGLPRGDVGRRPAGDLGARLRLRRVRDEHFERLERTAADPRFREALSDERTAPSRRHRRRRRRLLDPLLARRGSAGTTSCSSSAPT